MMNKILWHAVSTGARVRTSPTQEAPVFRLIAEGNWLGVINELGDWIYVISKEATGWVLKSELAKCDAHSLHIRATNTSYPQIGYTADAKKVA